MAGTDEINPTKIITHIISKELNILLKLELFIITPKINAKKSGEIIIVNNQIFIVYIIYQPFYFRSLRGNEKQSIPFH